MSTHIGDLHIDDFCKDTAKILLLLYKRFPVKTILYVEDIAGPDEPDEFGLHSPRFEACFSTIIWLKESDYLSYASTVRQEAVEGAALTHRGFCFVSAFENDDTNGEQAPSRRINRLNNAVKEGNSEYLKALVLRYMLQSRDYK